MNKPEGRLVIYLVAMANFLDPVWDPRLCLHHQPDPAGYGNHHHRTASPQQIDQTGHARLAGNGFNSF